MANDGEPCPTVDATNPDRAIDKFTAAPVPEDAFDAALSTQVTSLPVDNAQNEAVALVAQAAPAPPEAVEGKKVRARAQQQVWKAHEVDMLQQGVSKYGRNWKAILEDEEFAPTLGGRSPGSLKLKWYKMTKEHEEKINSATAWIQPGHHMPIGSMPFGRSWIDALASPEPGENGAFEPWRPEELHALREGVARYGLNFDAILNDPSLNHLLAKRTAMSMQAAWAQMQEVPRSWGQSDMSRNGEGRMVRTSTGETVLEGGGAASMRSWGRQETDALIKGFEAYGTDWKAILQDPRFQSCLSQRTCHSLKSKWARMMKKRKRDGEVLLEPMQKMQCHGGGAMPMRFGEPHTESSMSMNGFSSDPFGLPYGNGSMAAAAAAAAASTSMPSTTSVPETLPKSGATNEDYDRSISEYTRQISAHPANAILYNHRGVVYYAKGLVDKALDDFSTAIALDQSYADAYCNRGMAFNSKGEFDLAIMDCTTAIDINPTGSGATNAFLTRALTHYNKGMLEQCIFDCDSTLSLRPRCVSALVTRGLTVLALAKEGQHSDDDMQRNYVLALSDFKEAMSVDPNNQQARIWYDEARMLLLEHQNSMGSVTSTFHPSSMESLNGMSSVGNMNMAFGSGVVSSGLDPDTLEPQEPVVATLENLTGEYGQSDEVGPTDMAKPDVSTGLEGMAPAVPQTASADATELPAKHSQLDESEHNQGFENRDINESNDRDELTSKTMRGEPEPNLAAAEDDSNVNVMARPEHVPLANSNASMLTSFMH